MKKDSDLAAINPRHKSNKRKNKLVEYFFPSPEEIEARQDEENNYYWLVGDVFADTEEYQSEGKLTG